MSDEIWEKWEKRWRMNSNYKSYDLFYGFFKRDCYDYASWKIEENRIKNFGEKGRFVGILKGTALIQLLLLLVYSCLVLCACVPLEELIFGVLLLELIMLAFVVLFLDSFSKKREEKEEIVDDGKDDGSNGKTESANNNSERKGKKREGDLFYKDYLLSVLKLSILFLMVFLGILYVCIVLFKCLSPDKVVRFIVPMEVLMGLAVYIPVKSLKKQDSTDNSNENHIPKVRKQPNKKNNKGDDIPILSVLRGASLTLLTALLILHVCIMMNGRLSVEEVTQIIILMEVMIVVGFLLVAIVLAKGLDINKYQETWSRHWRYQFLRKKEMMRFIMDEGDYCNLDEDAKAKAFIANIIKIEEQNINKFCDNLDNKEKGMFDDLSDILKGLKTK